jgi:tetratricopeptide (TPR) repeat protein
MDPRGPDGLKRLAIVTIVILSVLWSLRITAQREPDSSDKLRREGIELAYNLDHDRALELLRRAVALAPDDSATHRSLASVLWLNILFRRGAVTVDHYLGSFSRAKVDLSKPPPELDTEFRKEVDLAVRLAEKQVSLRPREAQAHYDLGAAVGLQASYIATVEGHLLAGFRGARRSFDEHEQVLALDPAFADAGLVVGTYRYVVSTLSLPMRWMAYMAGFGGGRERGIALLEATAASGKDTRTDAMFALILVYNRERGYDDALRVIGGLREMYPRNRLVVLEQGATALRAGRTQQAEELLTVGLAMFAKDARAKIPGEGALWHYKRGAARVALKRMDAAVEDLRAATVADAQAWVTGRAHVELGRVAMARGDTAAAAVEAKQAESLCRTGNDPACVEDARRLLRNSHGR